MIAPDSRAIFISEIEQFGGAERSVLALAAWLHAHQLPHHILTYHDHCNLAQYATSPLEVVELNPASGVRSKVSALRKYLRSRPTNTPPMLCSGYQPALHATLGGARGFHTLMHDTPSLFDDEATSSLKTQLRFAVSNAIIGYGLRSGGVTIVTSEYLQSECRKDFRIEAHIQRMGGLSSAKHGPRACPSGMLNMLSVSRIEANKRIDWLLRALAALEHQAISPLDKPLSQLVDWHLHLAGKGPQLQALQALAGELGIADRVQFHGFVTDARLEELYAHANLFLMPAVQGYGIPAVEALNRGIPVMLHRDSGVSDVLLDTPWATVLRGDADATANALADAIAGVLRGSHIFVEPPALPSEPEWAEAVARLCHWVPNAAASPHYIL